MLHIYVCEDDHRFRKKLTEFIQSYLQLNDVHMEFALSTDSPKRVLEVVEGKKSPGLYFLDIELGGGKNGVLLAEKIRQYDPRGYIVFITAHTDYLDLTFELKVEALAYIKKTDGEQGIFGAVQSCIENAYDKHVKRSNEGYFMFTEHNGRRVSLPHGDILCIIADDGKRGSNLVVVHTKKRNYKVRDTLARISDDLPFGQFLRCHKSVIVNIANIPDDALTILSAGGSTIVLSDSTECKVSTRNKPSLIRLLTSPYSKLKSDYN